MFWLKIINTSNYNEWLTIGQCFIRSIYVNLLWWIPIVSIFFALNQYFKIKNEGITSYDFKFNTQIYKYNNKWIKVKNSNSLIINSIKKNKKLHNYNILEQLFFFL